MEAGRRNILGLLAIAGLALAGCDSGRDGIKIITDNEVQPAAASGSSSDTIHMTLKCGRVTIQLRPDLAPQHAERIKTLTGRGFYDGITFHRVIDGFMAQTGDPTGTGTGGSDLPDLPAEFSNVPFTRGVVGMARASSPDSANSQFFIMFAEASSLNNQYTVIGKVTDNMPCVDKIARGEPPANPDKIIKMELASDAG